MDELNKLRISAPVHVGDVLLPHIAGTDSNLVATKTLL